MVFTPESVIKTFKQRVFLVSIKISAACPAKLAFDPEQTRSENTVEVLKRNGGKLGKDGIPIFEVLGDKGRPIFSAAQARTRLSTILDSLQEKYMVSRGEGKEWYVPESKIEDLDRAIAHDLEPARAELLDHFSSYYDEAHSLFKERLTDILSSLGLSDWEPYYSSKFPSLEEIEMNFGYSIERWEPMKSLDEVMEESATDTALKRSAEVLEKQLKAIQEDAPRLQDEMLGKMAAVFCEMEEGDRSSEKSQAKITSALERVETLQGLWVGIFASENTLARTIYAEAIALSHSKEDTEAQLWKLREAWQKLALPAHGEGAIAFSHWLHPDQGLEAQITQTKQKLENPELSGKALARAEDKLKDLQELLEAKIAKLQAMFAPEPGEAASEALDAPEEESLEEIESDEIEEAGF